MTDAIFKGQSGDDSRVDHLFGNWIYNIVHDVLGNCNFIFRKKKTTISLLNLK
jgi:hypothetical protein